MKTNLNPIFVEERFNLGRSVSHLGRKMMKNADDIGTGIGVATGVGLTGIPMFSAMAGHGSVNGAYMAMGGAPAGILTGIVAPKGVYKVGQGIKSVGDKMRLGKIKKWHLKKAWEKKLSDLKATKEDIPFQKGTF